MKRILTVAIGLLFLTKAPAQKSGAVYYFDFKVDPELTEYIKTEDKSKTWFSGSSEEEAMPDRLIDSKKMKAEEAFTQKLKMPVSMCFRKNKKGEDVGSDGLSGMLEGLHFNTFNASQELCEGNIRFISLDVQIYPSGGYSIYIGDKKTKLKPMIELSTYVYDKNKKEIWKNLVDIKDFSKLRSVTKYYGEVEVTHPESLTPYDIYAIYLLGLDKLME